MEIRSRLAIGAGLLALMGCSPLPQAALVPPEPLRVASSEVMSVGR